jgi:DNA-binding NtrC family response regulator
MSACGYRMLIVEDEPILRVTIADAMRKEGWEVSVAEDGAEGLVLFDRMEHDLVLADLMMPKMGGLEVLRRIKETSPDTTVVILTAHATVDRAVEAMRAGAADFITKPFSMEQLKVRLSNVCSHRVLRQQNLRLQEQLEERYSFANIIGKSAKMQEVYDLITTVSKADVTVLIEGESGTGKELVANAIHYNSQRRSKPYIKVSCASLPETLIESELFGYERGAFTGANQRQIGRFEAADGGTLLLDEVGEIPLSVQVKLLRVLQERRIERLGSTRPRDVDVRIISASLRSLEEDVAEGGFREDLLFRINTVTIHLPPLRDRTEDIPLITRAFIKEFSASTGNPVEEVADEVWEALEAHQWPGNVRELRNVLERAVLFCTNGRLTLEELPPQLRQLRGRKGHRRSAAPKVVPLEEAVRDAEVSAIRRALEASGGHRSEAAKMLGISRKTLWEKIRTLGIEVP